MNTQTYNWEQMSALVREVSDRAAKEAAKAAAQEVLTNMNLDNGTAAHADGTPCMGGRTNMASQHRETYYYRDSDGKEKSIRLSGRSKRDTDEKYRQLIMDLMPCVKPTKASAPTLRQFIDRVYRPRFMATLEPTTADSYEQFIKLNILPFMGDRPMNEVDVSIVQEFMQWMATAKERGRKKNLNKATITRVCGLLNRMYKIAQAMNLVEDNPVKLQLLRNPGEEAGHHTAASDADVDMVKQRIPSLENEQQRLFAALLVYTGMRKEEVLGLKCRTSTFRSVTVKLFRQLPMREARRKHTSSSRKRQHRNVCL